MDIRQLQYFLKACETQSFTAASVDLFISQQGLSNSISRLEKEIGFSLFQRLPKGVVLTEEGLYFVKKAQEIVSLYEESMKYFRLTKEKKYSSLTICASYGVMMRLSEWLPRAFQAMYPSIKFTIIECPDLQCEELVAKSVCDIGFTSGKVDDTLYNFQPLFSTPINVIVHKTHPLAKFGSVDYSDLKGYSVYLMNDQFHTNHKFHKKCLELGHFKPKIGYETMDMSVVFNAVRNKYGIGIVNGYTATSLKSPELKILPFKDLSFIWDVSLLWKKDTEISYSGTLFKSYLINKFFRLDNSLK